MPTPEEPAPGWPVAMRFAVRTCGHICAGPSAWGTFEASPPTDECCYCWNEHGGMSDSNECPE